MADVAHPFELPQVEQTGAFGGQRFVDGEVRRLDWLLHQRRWLAGSAGLFYFLDSRTTFTREDALILPYRSIAVLPGRHAGRKL